MSHSRSQQLARQLHDKGLRKRLARQVADQPEQKAREVAEGLRRLATEVESLAGERGAEGDAAAHETPAAEAPVGQRRTRVRRN